MANPSGVDLASACFLAPFGSALMKTERDQLPPQLSSAILTKQKAEGRLFSKGEFGTAFCVLFDYNGGDSSPVIESWNSFGPFKWCFFFGKISRYPLPPHPRNPPHPTNNKKLSPPITWLDLSWCGSKIYNYSHSRVYLLPLHPLPGRFLEKVAFGIADDFRGWRGRDGGGGGSSRESFPVPLIPGTN
ncbi:hypothetical protein CEXT_442061 [Caerostris extrusa]|uniref:Uncharacterized protein n=1 Tax=Caerostris extrusa TaxID=172846 RepID=A0AAV4XVC7_CAEEX|nr:hypothetical protein CEXT_442061 [Caerostris extrusa]